MKRDLHGYIPFIIRKSFVNNIWTNLNQINYSWLKTFTAFIVMGYITTYSIDSWNNKEKRGGVLKKKALWQLVQVVLTARGGGVIYGGGENALSTHSVLYFVLAPPLDEYLSIWYSANTICRIPLFKSFFWLSDHFPKLHEWFVWFLVRFEYWNHKLCE